MNKFQTMSPSTRSWYYLIFETLFEDLITDRRVRNCVGFVGNENSLISFFFFMQLVYELRSRGTYNFIEIIKNESSVLL